MHIWRAEPALLAHGRCDMIHTYVRSGTQHIERVYRCTVARLAIRSSASRVCRRGLLHEWFSDQSLARVHGCFLALVDGMIHSRF